MAGGSLRRSFAERSKERLLSSSRKGYSELDLGPRGGSYSYTTTTTGDGCFRSIGDKFNNLWMDVQEIVIKLYEMGRSDPRKLIFAVKMGLALSFVSILIFFKEPLSYMSQYSIWAILTVVVVFEFSIGT